MPRYRKLLIRAPARPCRLAERLVVMKMPATLKVVSMPMVAQIMAGNKGPVVCSVRSQRKEERHHHPAKSADQHQDGPGNQVKNVSAPNRDDGASGAHGHKPGCGLQRGSVHDFLHVER